MATFAEKTPWTEDFILLRLPVSRAEQYYHHWLRGARYRTFAPVEIESVTDQIASIAEIPSLFVSPELAAAIARMEEEP